MFVHVKAYSWCIIIRTIMATLAEQIIVFLFVCFGIFQKLGFHLNHFLWKQLLGNFELYFPLIEKKSLCRLETCETVRMHRLIWDSVKASLSHNYDGRWNLMMANPVHIHSCPSYSLLVTLCILMATLAISRHLNFSPFHFCLIPCLTNVYI